MGKRRRLTRKLFLLHSIVLLAAVAITGWYIGRTVSGQCMESALFHLKAQTSLLEKVAQGKFSENHSQELDEILKEVAAKTPAHLTVFLSSGEIIADSIETPARKMDYMPEVKDALEGKPSTLTRPSLTTDLNMTYLAVPVVEGGRVAGVVRAGVAADSTKCWPKLGYTELTLGAILVVVFAGITSRYVSRRIRVPIAELRRAASSFESTDLDYRLDVSDSEEFGPLAHDLNTLAAQLRERMTLILGQRNELEAVLGGMVEAVLLIDTGERVLRVNRAGERLFRIDENLVKNRSVQEAIRNTDLHRFITRTLGGQGPIEGDITIIGPPDKFLQAHGTTLEDADGNISSAIVVLNDVTRLKTLENIRRDFVANVSHELKTPITSIKGFLETLRDGAVIDPENTTKFLEIIIKHADRLSEIIEDLLSLSRIERDRERGEIVLEEGPIIPVLESVVRACAKRCAIKNIAIQLDFPGDIIARINTTLLEQAVVNLVDNAVKYSEPGSSVLIQAFKNDDRITIRVKDSGCGIPKEHLTRIFERFYRVDKARSRKVGGTGLGLSIVRHIVNAHGGEISVESSPGRGSAFSICLPVTMDLTI